MTRTGRPRIDVLGVPIDDLGLAELLAELDYGAVFTPNVDIIMRARKDPAFLEILRNAEYLLCDSRIVQAGARFLGTPVREKISGSDFFPAFCEHHRDNPGIRVFLLGARPGVAAEAMRRVNTRCGREVVVGAHSPSFGFENDRDECDRIVELIRASGATVLAVGVGAPKQEKWIARHRASLAGVRIFLGIGATLDFEAGVVARAPRWMSRSGLEWLYRLAQEPRRLWRRYLVDDLPFFWLLLRQRASNLLRSSA